MSDQKATTFHWALPPTNTNTHSRPLTGRVIFGMLTGGGPDQTPPNETVITSAKRK